MTETLFTLSNPCDGERRAGTVGVPVPGCAVRIVDDAGADAPAGEPGEIFARSSGMMSAYWERPRETEAAFREGWFATGDVAIRGAGGSVRIVGRKSIDVIQSGGFKISAREVEDVLRTHPLVADVSVVGAPDPSRGERIVAAVVLRPGGTAPDAAALAADLADFAAQFLARYKCPREVRVLSELPRNAMGKVQKHRILELL